MRVLLTSVVLGLLVVATAAGSSNAPTVVVARMAPLVVSGAGFGSHATVEVSVHTGAKTLTKSVRASSTGAITARFSQSLTMYACRVTRVDAMARNGLGATWRAGSKSCLALAVPISSTG
jgi:hypothetical protein